MIRASGFMQCIASQRIYIVTTSWENIKRINTLGKEDSFLSIINKVQLYKR